MKYWFYILVFFLLSCSNKNEVDKSTILPFYNSQDFTPEWIPKHDDKYRKIHSVASFSLINQNGKTITNKDLKGKIYVADFFFTTCPSICPVLTKNMGKLQEFYKNDDDVMFLSHTVMPWVDTVEQLKEYAVNNNIDEGKWHLVTGEKEAIYSLARLSYFADEDFMKTKKASEFIHTENFVLVDKKGRIRGVYNGTLSLETKRLQKHIEILKKEEG